MATLLRILDRRLPCVAPADLDGWRELAEAGDTVARYRLGRSLLKSGPRGDLTEARRWLWQAAHDGFAAAQLVMAQLSSEGLVPGSKPGSSWWWRVKALRAWANSRRVAGMPLRERLRPYARPVHRLRSGERTKLHYLGAWAHPAVCAVEVGATDDGRLAVMFQSLPKANTGTSVTNMIEHVAFVALAGLLIDGYDVHPQDVAWFEVWPRTDWMPGKVHAVALTWDARAERYRDPVWSAIDVNDLPFDVSHALLPAGERA
ncbi:MAG: hypothetical protein ACTHL8_24340 [Burkholderiaceae bacterium]